MPINETKKLHRLFALLQNGQKAEVAAVVQLLRVQLEILRERLPERIRFTAGERRRLKQSVAAAGEQADDFLEIVTAATCKRWATRASPSGSTKRGRPPTKKSIEDLIVKMSTENDWGCTRIFAELRKLGLQRWTSRTTVRQIMIRKRPMTPLPSPGRRFSAARGICRRSIPG